MKIIMWTTFIVAFGLGFSAHSDISEEEMSMVGITHERAMKQTVDHTAYFWQKAKLSTLSLATRVADIIEMHLKLELGNSTVGFKGPTEQWTTDYHNENRKPEKFPVTDGDEGLKGGIAYFFKLEDGAVCKAYAFYEVGIESRGSIFITKIETHPSSGSCAKDGQVYTTKSLTKADGTVYEMGLENFKRYPGIDQSITYKPWRANEPTSHNEEHTLNNQEIGSWAYDLVGGCGHGGKPGEPGWRAFCGDESPTGEW